MALPEDKGVSALLSFPEKTCYASSNRKIGEWNLMLIDQVVQNAISHFPQELTPEDLQEYQELEKRLRLIKKQFAEHDYECTPFAQHIEVLSQKLELFRKEHSLFLQKTFSHPLVKRILAFEGVLDAEEAPKLRLKLMNFIVYRLVPAMSELKTYRERVKMNEILKKIVMMGMTLDTYDWDGSLSEHVNDLIKHFLFHLVISHHIYRNLLEYKPETLDFSSLAACQEAADGVNTFILDKLVPFLQDPDVQPCRAEIEKILENLVLLNQEFVQAHPEAENLLASSIALLKSFL